MNIKTAEFVSPGHPDKMCDYIADSILDAYLAGDKDSRVAVEVIGGHKLITVNGEVTSRAAPDLESLIKNIVGKENKNYQVVINLSKQSPSIAHGVDVGGAGDQGIMKGYATNTTPNFMPLEYELARNLCQRVYEKYPYDGKVQVTLEGTVVKTVIVSFQNTKNDELLPLIKNLIKSEEYLVNPAGEWTMGGFDADTGLSGRKIVVDAYGPEVPVGGGSFSGKDYTKVDRSGAYMARKIALDFVRGGKAKASPVAGLRPREAFVKLAYAIGKAEPVMAVAIIDGREVEIEGYDLSPAGIRKALNLDQVKFADTAKWGHFGRPEFPWEK